MLWKFCTLFNTPLELSIVDWAHVGTDVFILSPTFHGMATASESAVRSLFGESISATMRIINQSGKDIRLFWVNPEGLTLVSMSNEVIPSDGPSPPYFSAQVFHQFQIQESDGGNPVNFRVTDTEVGTFQIHTSSALVLLLTL